MPKTAVLTRIREIQIQERKSLEPKPQETIVRVELAGICGTDLALFNGDYKVNFPLIPGHEFVGQVTSVGEGVNSKWMNQIVTAEINNSCIAYNRENLCRACRVGLINHCQSRTVTGIINHDGAFAEEVAVPVGILHKIPEGLDSSVAVLTEPLAAAIQTFETFPNKRPGTVAILGPGRLGILITFIASLRGHKVLAISRNALKRERAVHFGAAEACSPKEAERSVQKMTEGMGVDIAVAATGNPEGLDLALKLVRPRGTVAVKTTCGIPANAIDIKKPEASPIALELLITCPAR